jgi:hypothetical protein
MRKTTAITIVVALAMGGGAAFYKDDILDTVRAQLVPAIVDGYQRSASHSWSSVRTSRRLAKSRPP